MSENKTVTRIESDMLHAQSLDHFYGTNRTKPEGAKPEGATQRIPQRVPLSLRNEMSFGKHKGETVKWVVDNHLGYIIWILDDEVREFEKEAMEYIQNEINIMRGDTLSWLD